MAGMVRGRGAKRRRAFTRRVVVAAVLVLQVPIAAVVLSEATGSRRFVVWLALTMIGGTVAFATLLHHWLLPLERARDRLELCLEAGTLTAGGPYRRGEVGDLLRNMDAMFRRLDDARVAATHAANTDALTGAATRRATLAHLHELQEHWVRGPGGLTIALLDIDWFKQVNDRLGHDGGDYVLTRLVQLLQAVDGHQIVGRWGGDEFLVAVAASPQRTAESLDAVRAALAEDTRTALGATVTFSAGISPFDDARQLRAAIADADFSLYEAKRRGRDIVVHLPHEPLERASGRSRSVGSATVLADIHHPSRFDGAGALRTGLGRVLTRQDAPASAADRFVMDEDRVLPFATELLRSDGAVVVSVRGEIDFSTAPEFRVAVESAVDDSDRVEVDLRNTSFLDSSGLAVLVDASRRLGEAHEVLVVRDPQPVVRRVLDVLGVDVLIDVRYSAGVDPAGDAEGEVPLGPSGPFEGAERPIGRASCHSSRSVPSERARQPHGEEP